MSKQETKSEQRKPKQLSIFRQKRRGRQDTAFTVIDGRRIHLGIYGTPEAEKEYRRVVAEWNAGIIAPKQTNADITVAELVLRFLKERQNKVSPTQWDNEHRIGQVLVSLYGDTDVAKFDVNCLRTVRNVFIQKQYVRQKINERARIIQHVFRWGVSYKIVPANVHHELKTLMPIKKGEYDLPESRQRPIVSLAINLSNRQSSRLSSLRNRKSLMNQFRILNGTNSGKQFTSCITLPTNSKRVGCKNLSNRKKPVHLLQTSSWMIFKRRSMLCVKPPEIIKNVSC